MGRPEEGLMNEIQKAIDEAKYKTGVTPISYRFTAKELKSLIEQVTREQRVLCCVNWSKPTSGTIEDARLILEAPLVTKNLTFNKD